MDGIEFFRQEGIFSKEEIIETFDKMENKKGMVRHLYYPHFWYFMYNINSYT